MNWFDDEQNILNNVKEFFPNINIQVMRFTLLKLKKNNSFSFKIENVSMDNLDRIDGVVYDLTSALQIS